MLALALALAAPACSNNPYPDADDALRVFYTPYSEPPKTLDPQVAYATVDHDVLSNVYETLLKQWGGVPEHLQNNFARYLKPTADPSTGGTVDLSGGTTAARQAVLDIDGTTLRERGVLVAGNPEECIKAIKLHEQAGVDQIQFLMATESVPHDKVMKSIEMFGKHVIPAFKKSEAVSGR